MTLPLFKGVTGMTLWGKDYEIALYYLYMIADGELSPEEMTIFKSICQKLDKIDEYQNIITYCKGLGQTSSFNKIVDEDIETEIEDYYDDEELSSSFSKGHLIEIIWNLISLGFCDKEYSQSEEKIVKYLCESWEIDDSIYLELIECAKTLVRINKYRDWAYKTFAGTNKLLELEDQIDKNIKSIEESIVVCSKEFVAVI